MSYSLLKRYLIFTIGLYLLTLGVVLIVKASLGTSPISSLTYVVSLHTPLTLGVATVILNMLLMVGEFWFIRDRMTRKDVIEILMQLPFSLLFGAFIDINMWLLGAENNWGYAMSIMMLVLGCVIQAIGVVIEIKPNVAKMSGEGFVNYASLRYNKDFGKVKVIFDITLVTLAVIVSLFITSGVEGVREGTLISALSVGALVTVINRYMTRLLHLSGSSQ